MTQKKPECLDQSGLRRAAIDLLARRDYSRLELFRKLNTLSKHQDDLEFVLNELQQRQWQSDERFAESFLNSRCQRGLGPLRLRQELREKGIARETIGLAIEAAEIDWYLLAQQTAEKKLTSYKETDNKKQKLFRFLAYRGFSGDHISAVFESLEFE